MEIRDPVHGTLFLSDAEVRVLESREFQRLRAIKQLGFAEFSFPGGTHNRFLHSIGVSHLAGLVFDQILRNSNLTGNTQFQRLRALTKIAALLHDVGHGPLSHTTEDVMPMLSELAVAAYEKKQTPPAPHLFAGGNSGVRASHEDYTIKYITDSPLTPIIEEAFPEFTPYDIACLIDRWLPTVGDSFIVNGVDYRPVLSQIVSSELDCDRMDYLERDSYFCGTNYGRFDLHWLTSNLSIHRVENKAFLAMNRRALYTFDDFLISRHHMHLMVYFHHKSVIFEEMLTRYLTSEDCTFFLPADISEYTTYNDYKLFEHLAQAKNPWAKRITERRPFKVLVELHNTEESPRPKRIIEVLEAAKIQPIWASSKARLSKYHSTLQEDSSHPIFVVDQYDRWDKPSIIDRATEIFQKYEGARIIDRIYVAPEDFEQANKVLASGRFY